MLEGLHSVLITDKKIGKIAVDSEFTAYAGLQYDFTGKTLMPGIIDCHIHLFHTASGDPKADGEKMGPSQITLTALKNAQAT